MHWQVVAISGSKLVAPPPPAWAASLPPMPAPAWAAFAPPATNTGALPSTATAEEIFAASGFPGKGRPRPPTVAKQPAFPPPPNKAAPTTPPTAFVAAPFQPATVAGPFQPANVCPEALHNCVLKVMCVASLGLRLDKLRFCWKCFSMSWFSGGGKCTNPGCRFFGFSEILPAFQAESQLYCSIHDEIGQIMFDRNIADCMAAGQLVQVYMHTWPSLNHICIEAPEEAPVDDFDAAAKSGAVPKAKSKAKAAPKTKGAAKKTIQK